MAGKRNWRVILGGLILLVCTSVLCAQSFRFALVSGDMHLPKSTLATFSARTGKPIIVQSEGQDYWIMFEPRVRTQTMREAEFRVFTVDAQSPDRPEEVQYNTLEVGQFIKSQVRDLKFGIKVTSIIKPTSPAGVPCCATCNGFRVCSGNVSTSCKTSGECTVSRIPVILKSYMGDSR